MGSSDAEMTHEPILPNRNALSQDPAFIEFAAQVLGNSELADGLSPGQLAQLATIGAVRSYSPDDLICDEHERSDELYLVETGTVEIWLNPSSIGDAGEPRKIAGLQAGQICGELALLDGGVRSAQVRAGPNGVKVLAFSRNDVLDLCEADTAIGYRLMRNLAGALALRLRLQDMRLYSSE
jgi:CRP/FNR family transcriptional regulator, cyclic AMP receptor protein